MLRENNSGSLKVKFLHLVHFTGHIKKTMSFFKGLLTVYNVWDGGRKAKRLSNEWVMEERIYAFVFIK